MAAIGTVYNNWMSSVDSSWLDSSECRYTANDDDGGKAIAVNENKDDRVLKLCVQSIKTQKEKNSANIQPF